MRGVPRNLSLMVLLVATGLFLVAGELLAVPLYFPGQFPIPMAGPTTRVLGLDYDNDGAQELLVGIAHGELALIGYNPDTYFTVVARFTVAGIVTDLKLLPMPDVADTLLAVGTRDPDAVLFISYEAGAEPFTLVATVPLEEDPGWLATGPIGPQMQPAVAVALPGYDRLQVLADLGEGWQIVSDLPCGDRPTSVVLYDVDPDGVPEIVTADSGYLSERFSIFRRQPDGYYALESQPLGPATPNYLTTFDQDDDGTDELYATYSDASYLSVFAPDGGGFTEIDRVATPAINDGVYLAAIGEDDLGLMAWNTDRGVVQYFRREADAWSLFDTFYTGGRAVHATVVDLNADGYTDLAIAHDSSNTVALLFGNNLPSFRGYGAALLPTSPVVSLASDLDGDTDLDYLIATSGPDSDEILTLHNDGAGRFAIVEPALALATTPGDMALAFIDEDLVLDLLVPQVGLDAVQIFGGLAGGGFVDLGSLDMGESPFGVVVGDLDLDGAVDVVAANATVNSVTIAYGIGDGTFSDVASYDIYGDVNGVCLLDIDADDLLDLVVANGLGGLSIRRNLGNRQFATASFMLIGGEPTGMAMTDMDDDEDLDLVVVNPVGGYITVLENEGDGSLNRRYSQYEMPGVPVAVAGGDLNLDGRGDIIVSLAETGEIAIVLLLEDWFLSPPQLFDSAQSPGVAVVGDFNGDGFPDLMVPDRELELALTMLNVEPNPVPVVSPHLVASCGEGLLWLTVHAKNGTDWLVEGLSRAGWTRIGDGSHRPVGSWQSMVGGWIVSLDAEDVQEQDLLVVDGDYRFRLSAAGRVASEAVVHIESNCLEAAHPSLPPRLSMAPPYPNPFNPVVNLDFVTGRSGMVAVTVYDSAGRLITELARGWFAAGQHRVVWDGTGASAQVAAGIYLIKVDDGSSVTSQKVMLVK